METPILDVMRQVIDDYIHAEDLNALLKDCIRDKSEEQGLWSAMTVAAHGMFGGSSPHIERMAANTELIMLGLDIMDDLQDKDNPDKPWMKCPEAFALNAVMALLMAAVGDIARIEALELANGRMPGDSLAAGISRFIADAVNGQQRDINDSITTEHDYVQMVYEKSGSLVKLACYLGYALAERRDPGTVQQMDEVATLVGFMAQLQNDIADVMRWDLKNDIFFKRKTLPLQFLLEVSEEDFPDLKRFYDGEITQDDLIRVKRECMQFILDSGCIEYSKTIQLLHLNRAEEVLAAMDVVPEWKERFAKLAFDPFRV